VVAEVRERLAVNKLRLKRFYMERFNLKELNKIEGNVPFGVDVSNRSAALEHVDAEADINSAWETIRENMKTSPQKCPGYYELKKHKPWFDAGYSKLLYSTKEAKLQWLQEPSEINGVNLKNSRREASRHFRNKKREYLKGNINYIAANS
jgi:hypothetical protein